MNFRRVGINMISGGAGFLVPMAVNVFSTPYVISQLGKEAYGLQALANVIIGYLVVADMGLDIPITKKMAEFQEGKDTHEKSKFIGATLKIYLTIGALGMGIVLLFSKQLMSLLSIPETLAGEARIVFYLTAFGFLGSILNTWGKAIFNGMQRYEISNSVGIFNNLLGVVAGILLVAAGYGAVGFIFARVASFFIASIVYIVLASRHITSFTFLPVIVTDVWAYLKRQVGYGFSLRISGMIFSRMDQTLISSWLGIAMVTAYAVPILIVQSINGFIVSITHFAFPMASAMNVSRPVAELESFFIKISRFIVAIASLVFVPIFAFSGNLLTLWISPEMASESTSVLMILTFAFYLNTCVATALVAFVAGLGYLSRFTVYGVGRGVLLFLGFVVFIKLVGLEGAGWSYVFTVLLDVAFFIYATTRILKFHPGTIFMRSYLKPMALAFALAALLYYFNGYVNSWVTLIGASGAFCIAYILIGYKIDIFGQTEKNAILALLKRR